MGFSLQTAADTATLMVQAAATKPRHIEMQLGDDDFNHLTKVASTNKLQVLEAIGRFSAYAVHGDYDRVVIYRNGDDMEAYFTDSASSRRMVMGAVWNNQTNRFGYHT